MTSRKASLGSDAPLRPIVSELQIENFKSIAGAWDIPLGPITLIYGPNSAGKSSIIQALALLGCVVLRNGFTTSLGEPVNLNPKLPVLPLPSKLINRNATTTSGRLTVGIKFFDNDAPPSLKDLPHHISFTHSVTTGETITGIGPFGLPDIYFSPEANEVSWKEPNRRIPLNEADRLDNIMEFLEAQAEYEDRLKTLYDFPIETQFDSRCEDISTFASKDLLPDNLIPPYTHLSNIISKYLSNLYDQLKESATATAEQICYIDPLRQRDPLNDREAREALLSARTRKLLNKWFEQLGIDYRIDSNLALRNRDCNFDFTEVGTGLSQITPILVECATGVEKVICIEQPELHLHPKLSGDLAELLAEAAVNGNQIIAETHSEHILNRIRHLIRTNTLRPEDVCVLYVEPGIDSAEITRIRLDREGDLVDTWPSTFFGEIYQY